MKYFKTALKIVTTLSYFLPFVFFFISCDGSIGFDTTFNKEEAKKIKLKNGKTFDSKPLAIDSLDEIVVTIDSTDIQSDSTASIDKDSSNGDISELNIALMSIYTIAIFPAEESLSGFGLLIFHNEISFVLIAISMLISILIFFEKLVPVIKRNRIVLYAVSFSSLLLFIVYSIFISDVDLEWGIFVTIALTFIGLYLAVKDKMTTTSPV